MTPATAVLVQLLEDFSRQQVALAIALVGDIARPERQLDPALEAAPTTLNSNPLQSLSLPDARTILLKQTAQLKPLMRRRNQPIANFSGKSRYRLVGYFDDNFPDLLREIPDPPLLLFYEGHLDSLANPTVAIVGARRCTSVGANLAREMAACLASQGICIVSGLALGIDGAAHRGSLGVQGATAAFLGASLEELYPREHLRLSREIVDSGGLLVSEYPPAVTPRRHHFPERNRLISGAAQGIVLVEASEKSGSLITARLGLEQGRDVYAMPGPVLSQVSNGCHRMIQQGAGLVTSAADVLQELGWSEGNLVRPATAELSATQAAVYAFLDAYPFTIDELMLRVAGDETLGDVDLVTQVLVELELMGFVQQSGVGYIRTS